MKSRSNVRYRLLRGVLLFCGVTWGVSIVGVFASWETVLHAMTGFGANPVAYDPMLDYWLRMVAGAFGLLGGGYCLLALNPRRHVSVLPWAGWLMIVEGVVLTAHGFRLGLAPFPFYGDISACLFGGGGILMLMNAPRSDADQT